MFELGGDEFELGDGEPGAGGGESGLRDDGGDPLNATNKVGEHVSEKERRYFAQE